MHNSAKILSVAENGSVTVLPLIKNACISCSNTSCTKAGKPFIVQNPYLLPLKPGMTVHISAKKRTQAAQAFTSLLLPVVCATGGWFAADACAASLNISSGEWLQAIGVLLGLFIPSAFLLVINKHKKPAYGEIIEIAEN